jgi:hypothetical protein
MEEVMLGLKRTLPLWQAKRQRVPLERALSTPRAGSATKAALAARALAAARARKRLAEESKKKARFAER